jgi:hypothetical protein
LFNIFSSFETKGWDHQKAVRLFGASSSWQQQALNYQLPSPGRETIPRISLSTYSINKESTPYRSTQDKSRQHLDCTYIKVYSV